MMIFQIFEFSVKIGEHHKIENAKLDLRRNIFSIFPLMLERKIEFYVFRENTETQLKITKLLEIHGVFNNFMKKQFFAPG